MAHTACKKGIIGLMLIMKFYGILYTIPSICHRYGTFTESKIVNLYRTSDIYRRCCMCVVSGMHGVPGMGTLFSFSGQI